MSIWLSHAIIKECIWDVNISHTNNLTSSPSVISAVLYGAMAVGEANSFAPNYAKAKMSASHLMMLLNKEPAIDNLSHEGEEPVCSAPRPNTILTVQLINAHANMSLSCLIS